MRSGAQSHRMLLAAAALAAAALLSGCAGLMLLNSVGGLVNGLPPSEPNWVETNRLTLGGVPTDVYALLEQEVERNGRKIVERDAVSRTLLVAYPFSLLKNNWGGTIRVICIADAYGTTVTILGDGRDIVPHVRAIGDEVLADVSTALRRLPRTL